MAARLCRLTSALSLMEVLQVRCIGLWPAAGHRRAVLRVLSTRGISLPSRGALAVVSTYLTKEVVVVAVHFHRALSGSRQHLGLGRVQASFGSHCVWLRRQRLAHL